MHRDHRFAEDIPQLAAQTAEVAKRLCGACQNYHLLWPYIRLIGAGGAKHGEAGLSSAISHAVAGGRRDILIAGAADTGLLSVVARATLGLETDIVVLDRCETPLELCRRFASRWALKIEILHTDLREFSAQSRFDVIVAHGVLPFISSNYRLDVLRRLRRSLRPNGRLLMRFRTTSGGDINHMPVYSSDVPKYGIEYLNKMNIALPEQQDDFRNRIKAYVEERRTREGALGDPAEVEGLLDSAGFIIESITPIEADLSAPFENFAGRVSRLRYLTVAAPK